MERFCVDVFQGEFSTKKNIPVRVRKGEQEQRNLAVEKSEI
jgi:hypothetical protein